MKWIECQGCGIEYRVISDSDEQIEFCPYCGEPIEHEEDEDEYYEEDIEE